MLWDRGCIILCVCIISHLIILISLLYHCYFIITTYKNSTQILKELIISIDCKQIQEPNVPKLLKTYVPMQTYVSKFLSI